LAADIDDWGWVGCVSQPTRLLGTGVGACLHPNMSPQHKPPKPAGAAACPAVVPKKLRNHALWGHSSSAAWLANSIYDQLASYCSSDPYLPGLLAEVVLVHCVGCMVDVKRIQNYTTGASPLQGIVHATYACSISTGWSDCSRSHFAHCGCVYRGRWRGVQSL
jgi:hypothetical protein